ncbi:MAG: S1 RNA-binding domain-containing protein [Chloroflexi bacterium]|nr:S1 RNA-binding domain-containing protein [Chloroflexota bacterium]
MDFLLQTDFNLPVAGEIRYGYVVEHRNNEVLVDIGAKSEGVITNREVETLDEKMRVNLAIGNKIPVFIVDPEDESGNIILSYVKAAAEQDWLDAENLLDTQEVYETVVVGFNRGGILVKVGHLRGFVPNSQLHPSNQAAVKNDTDQPSFHKLVGKKIFLKVIEANRERNRLILSEKAAAQEVREARRGQLLDSIQEGDIHEGRVVNLADFGAFIDIGGIEGLVHLSELSWKRVNNPAEKLSVGDTVQVCVLKIDQERQRLALSIKRLEADPWTLIKEMYHEGQLTTATITKLTKFGAFARLHDEYELEGLIHISELSGEHVTHPREVVKPSQEVTVRIIRIDSDQRQLGLSLKQVASAEYLEADLEMLNSA